MSASSEHPTQTTSALVNATLAYAAAGWPVFPCNRDKQPLTEHGHLDATTNAEMIRAWWQQLPEALIGVAIPGGAVVVDVDGPAGWAALEAEGLTLPATLTAITGRGQWHRHLWYRLPTGVAIGCKRALLQCVDVRGQGGYVIVPPSRSVFGLYSWLDGFGLAKIAPAPAWVIERCQPARPPGQARPADEWVALLHGPVPEGHRHETLLRVAGLLLRRHDAPIGVELARAWAEARLVPPLPEPEAARIIGDALTLEQRRLTRQSGGRR
ncbi:MAG: bifunctional DNA primase/polymerase [Thermoanaerobaculales bacterium]